MSGVNDTSALSFNQLSTVMASIYSYATGTKQAAAVDTSGFISQAQRVIHTGVDPVMKAISQVLNRTIFDIRPYNAQFTEIEWNRQKWGNRIRKISFADGSFEDDERFDLTDTQSVDMFKVKKPKVFETQWFNSSVFQKHYTIFRDQLDVAFTGPDEFQRFLTGVTTNVSDMLEQSREEFARSILANYIGALYAQNASSRDNGRVIKLCTEFCTEMGISTGVGETYATPRDAAFADSNYDKFMKWLFARIAILSKMMTERSQLFQSLLYEPGASVGADPVLVPIMHHTPYENQRMYLFVDVLKNIDTRVLSAAFHDNYLKIGKHNTVTYWQSIDGGSYRTGAGSEADPYVTHNLYRDSVYVTPSCITNLGAYVQGSTVDVQHVFGILFDENAVAMTQGSTWSAPTPFNAAGGYTNVYYHLTLSGMNDMAEKGILLLLD